MIRARDYEGKRSAFLATVVSGLILCVCCLTLVQAVAGATNKTDAALAEAVTGTWEALPSEGGFSKTFLTFNADGTGKVIGIIANDGSPRRSEGEGRWRINHGYLIAKPMMTFQHGVRMRFDLRVRIESIENGMVRLRDEKGDEGQMRRIGHLPSLPALITPTVLTQEQAAKMAIYRPQPEYPMQARARRMTGDGLFILSIRIRTGLVKEVRLKRSTGSSILDSAAVSTLKQWRFRPCALSPQGKDTFAAEDYFLEVPVRFVMSKRESRR